MTKRANGSTGHVTQRAVVYGRVSYDDSDTDGRNLKGQLTMGCERAAERGHRVIAELAEDDKGASGASFELPKLGQALEMARAGEFDIFIVREIDRLSRNLAKQLAVEHEFKRHGVVIDYVLGDYPDTPEGNLLKNMRASIAEFEREQINIRMTRARQNKVKEGSVITHGRAPYGYRLQVSYRQTKDGKVSRDRIFSLAVHEPEAAIVRLIFDWYAVQRLSLSEMCRRLKELHVVTKAETGGDALRPGANGYRKQRGPSDWANSTLHHILGNETYCGTWRYGKDTGNTDGLAVAVPAIISRELWEQAQDVKRANAANGRRQTRYDYLMRRRLVCGHCGSKIVGTGNRGNTYYRCQATKSNYARKCDLGQRTFSGRQIDDEIWRWVRGLLSEPDLVEEGFEQYEAAQAQAAEPVLGRIKTLDTLIADNRAQLARLLDLYLAGDFEKDLLTDRKQRLEETIHALEKERDAMAGRLAGVTLTDRQKRDIRAFAAKAGKGLSVADRSFAARRKLVELLDVTATLALEDGQKVAYARCVLGERAFGIVSGNTGTPSTVLAACWLGLGCGS
jgi:site-specific DNA recombinase